MGWITEQKKKTMERETRTGKEEDGREGKGGERRGEMRQRGGRLTTPASWYPLLPLLKVDASVDEQLSS